MGSKTPGEEDQGRHESPNSSGSYGGGEAKGAHLSRDGDGCMGIGGDADSDDDDDADANNATTPTELKTTASGDANATTKTKKKRKRTKKKSKASGLKQSFPPRIPLDQLYPDGNFAEGELLNHPTVNGDTQTSRVGPAELRYNNRLDLENSIFLHDYRKAAEVHRQTRKWVRESVQPGQTLTQIAVGIEDSVRALLDNPGNETGQCLKSGMGFPTGLALNNCVAHYTPNPGMKDIVLKHSDVMKVDFGVHVNGWIVDSAFTLAFDPVYDNLLAAVKDATNTGIRNAGIDVRISDVSAAIQETMESYEVEIAGKTYPVKPVRNLCGHDIKHYKIHGSKQIPFIKNSDQTKMEAGEIFAIETFGSTGKGRVQDDIGIYGYGLTSDAPSRVNLPLTSANRLFKTIKDNFSSIVFCRRYLEHLGCERYLAGLNSLVANGILDDHKPLVDIPGSYSAQFEHTILLRESNKEVLSRGSDY